MATASASTDIELPTPLTEFIEKWECFCDDSYYHLWAVRPVGDGDFSSQKLFHVQTEQEAKALTNILNNHQAIIEEKGREIGNLKTVMIAAAEEIAEHWEAHCDEEGYGPSSLLRRLEHGIPVEYGYTAGNFKFLQENIEEKDKEIAKLKELAMFSPIESERRWQHEQIKEIFSDYPDESFIWQYLNGLISLSRRCIQNTNTEQQIQSLTEEISVYKEFMEYMMVRDDLDHDEFEGYEIARKKYQQLKNTAP